MAIKFGRPIEMRDAPRRQSALAAHPLDLAIRPRRNRKAEWARRLVRVAQEAMWKGIGAVRPGARIGDVGHALVVGPTGAGKSVLLALMALQFRRYPNAQVFAFDKGKSMRAAILSLAGSFHDLGGEGAPAFQPLRDIDGAAARSRAQSWLLGILAQQGVAVDPSISDALWLALTNLAEAPVRERTLTGLTLLIQRADIRDALRPFTIDGPHGALFDAEAETLDLSDIEAFEMEALMRREAAVAPALAYLFDRLDARFDGRPTLLLIDEAWVFLDHPLFAGQIREWLKVLRKKNVSVVFATQGLADIAESAIAPTIIESCPQRVLLPNDPAIQARMDALIGVHGLEEFAGHRRPVSTNAIRATRNYALRYSVVEEGTGECNRLLQETACLLKANAPSKVTRLLRCGDILRCGDVCECDQER